MSRPLLLEPAATVRYIILSFAEYLNARARRTFVRVACENHRRIYIYIYDRNISGDPAKVKFAPARRRERASKPVLFIDRQSWTKGTH